MANIALLTGPLEPSQSLATLNALIETINADVIGSTGQQVVTETSAATVLGNTIAIDTGLTLSATGIVSGNGYANRSITTLSGTVTGGAFVAGIRCGVRLSGTMNHADSRIAGLFVKLDDTGATETTGQLSVLWVDHGAGITGAHGGQFNMIRITDTVAGSKGNAVIYAYANATNFIEVGAPSSAVDYYIAAGTSAGSAGKSDGCAAQKVFVITVNGVANYIPVFTQNS